MRNEVQAITERLLDMFASEDFPARATRTFILRQEEDTRPCQRWSISNLLIMLSHGTEDARGFRQWNQVNRYVKKGSKAIYILAPLIIQKTVTDVSAGEEKVRTIIKGFRTVPVFPLEATEGEDLPAYFYEPPDRPPLYEVARQFGVVDYLPRQGPELGATSLIGSVKLYSHDVDVFFHELGHQAHGRITPLKAGQHMNQELIAEMVSCILCEMYGYTGYLWHGWEYIKDYAGNESGKALSALVLVLGEVEKVVNLILASNNPAQDTPAAICA